MAAVVVEVAMGRSRESFADGGAMDEAAAGIHSIEKLIHLMTQSQQKNTRPAPPADSKFARLLSFADRGRIGHARFRRGPIVPPAEVFCSETPNLPMTAFCPTPIQQIPVFPSREFADKFGREVAVHGSAAVPSVNVGRSGFAYSPPLSAGTSPFSSSLSGDTADIKQPSSSSAFPFPSLKRKCAVSDAGKCAVSSSGRCHCSKRKKLRIKRTVRVPAISMKMADIPPDDFSWRKYGQKPIKGSPHPRSYYKCSSVRGCPARKHVERAVDDTAMLVVTYEGEHSHSLAAVAEPAGLILESS